MKSYCRCRFQTEICVTPKPKHCAVPACPHVHFYQNTITVSLSLWSYVCLDLPLLVKAVRSLKSELCLSYLCTPSADHRALQIGCTMNMSVLVQAAILKLHSLSAYIIEIYFHKLESPRSKFWQGLLSGESSLPGLQWLPFHYVLIWWSKRVLWCFFLSYKGHHFFQIRAPSLTLVTSLKILSPIQSYGGESKFNIRMGGAVHNLAHSSELHPYTVSVIAWHTSC